MTNVESSCADAVCERTPVNFPPSVVSNCDGALDDERAKSIICRATIKIKQTRCKAARGREKEQRVESLAANERQ
jgi:hypothetical protein